MSADKKKLKVALVYPEKIIVESKNIAGKDRSGTSESVAQTSIKQFFGPMSLRGPGLDSALISSNEALFTRGSELQHLNHDDDCAEEDKYKNGCADYVDDFEPKRSKIEGDSCSMMYRQRNRTLSGPNSCDPALLSKIEQGLQR